VSLATATGLSLGRRLQRTSLALEQSELVCLVGPNGSGKTSLLHAIAGIGAPAGEVRIDDENPRLLSPPRRQRLLTYLPASRDIKWPLVASDLIALGLPPGCDTEEICETLELGEFLHRPVDQLSTGERSRVLIARALAPRPRLLLLDEPTANLDPLWQILLMDYLRRLTRETGCAALIAVHDLEIARRFADRLILMDGGGIAAEGEPAALIAGPRLSEVFGIEWSAEGWRPLALRRPEDRRSSP
jgi:iron complex transport system ATP-binding protein